MQPETTFVLLVVILVSTIVQTTVGFGLGLIVVSAATIFDIVPIVFSTALVSFTSFFHILVAMRGEWRSVDWRRARMIIAGLVPSVFVGVRLLDFMTANSVDLLKIILGVVVLIGATVSLLKFRHYAREPGYASGLLIGVIGGLGGGMFSNSAAPVVYHLHRQRMSFSQIRNTLFAVFLISTFTRIVIITIKGDVNAELLITVAMALPVIAVTALLTKKYPLPMGIETMRRITFVLLAVMGASLILSQ